MVSILLFVEAISTTIVVGIAFLIMHGFGPIAFDLRGSQGVRALARAVLLITVASTIQVVYYSFLISPMWRQAIGKLPANFATVTLLIGGGYYILRVLWLTIPEVDRHKYNILTAAFYPRDWKRMLGFRLEEFINWARKKSETDDDHDHKR